MVKTKRFISANKKKSNFSKGIHIGAYTRAFREKSLQFG